MDGIEPADLEDLYERLSRLGNVTKNDMQSALIKDTKGNIVRPVSSGISTLSGVLARPHEVRQQIEDSKNFTQLKSARESIDDVEVKTQIKPLRDSAEERKTELVSRLVEARRISTEFKDALSSGDEAEARRIKGSDLNLREQAWLIVGREPSASEVVDFAEEDRIR